MDTQNNPQKAMRPIRTINRTTQPREQIRCDLVGVYGVVTYFLFFVFFGPHRTLPFGEPVLVAWNGRSHGVSEGRDRQGEGEGDKDRAKGGT